MYPHSSIINVGTQERQFGKEEAVSEQKKVRFNPDEAGYKSVTFKIRMSEEIFQKLENLSKKQGKSKAEIIRSLIEKAK